MSFPSRRSAAIQQGLAALLVLFALEGCGTSSRFMERSVTVSDRTYGYRVWLPPHYTKLKRWPVILYLHGSNERGDDNLRQVSVGLGPALEQFEQRYHCIVVFPQCLPGQEWYGEMETQAMAALESVVGEFHGDRRRLYLTGVSMGGAGTWYMGRHRKKFAAIVPVCGEVARERDDPFPTDPPPDVARIVGSENPFATLAEAIGSTPVWAFHGADDTTVPVTQSRRMVAALRNAGARVHYTEYPGVGHACWDLAYSDETMVQWLQAQRLR